MKKAIKCYPNDINDWLSQAEDDLKWAKHDFSGGFYSQVCFIAQQIAEKALKAYLLSQEKTVKKTHNLPTLLEQCQKHHRNFSQFIKPGGLLDTYYTETRYPSLGPKGEYSKEEAEEALVLAKKILQFVKKELKRG